MDKFELPQLDYKSLNKPDFNLDIKLEIDRSSQTFYQNRKASVDESVGEQKAPSILENNIIKSNLFRKIYQQVPTRRRLHMKRNEQYLNNIKPQSNMNGKFESFYGTEQKKQQF